MLPVTETAFDGASLSIPQVVTLAERHYVAIRTKGRMSEMPSFAPPLFPELHGWMAAKGVRGTTGFFRYLAFGDDGSVEMEVATLTDGSVEASGRVSASSLPQGRYVSATYTGPYDRLYDAFCMLSGWVDGRGLCIAETMNGGMRRPDVQAELYHVSPADTPDPAQWRTELLIRLID